MPIASGHDPDEIPLDLHGILFPGQAQPLRDPPHMGVDDDALGISRLCRDHVRRLAGDARQP